MINRNWLRCFRPGNAEWAVRVAAFMREDFDWEVQVDRDENRIIHIESNNGEFDCSDIDEVDDWSNEELLNQFVSNVGVSSSRLAKLDRKFGIETSSIGKYTKVPLPKDIKKESKDGNTAQAV